MNKKYITTKEASEICGVSQVTIQHLCRDKVLRHKRNGKMYLVHKDDVLSYNADISEIYEQEISMEEYRKGVNAMYEERKKAHDEMRDKLYAIKAFPSVVESMRTFARQILNGLEELGGCPEFLGCTPLVPREIKVLRMIICDGYTQSEVSEEINLTRSRVQQVFNRAVYKVRRYVEEVNTLYGKIVNLQCENESLSYSLGKAMEVIKENEETIARKDSKVDAQRLRIIQTVLKDTKLSTRLLHCLLYNDINTVEDLASKEKLDLLKLRNFGKKTLGEVCGFLEGYGLRLGMSKDDIMTYLTNGKE